MFFGENEDPAHARDDPGQRRAGRATQGAKEAPPDAARDFEGIFKRDGRLSRSRSVLLDPPLHEFLPQDRRGRHRRRRRRSAHQRRRDPREASNVAPRVQPDARATAAAGSASPSPRSTRCRSRAIIEAACACAAEGIDGQAGDHDSAGEPRRGELALLRALASARRSPKVKPSEARARSLTTPIGTMIEVPRAAH